MDFNHYQAESRKTAIYPDVGKNLVYPVLGLCGEVGELANKVKKIMRDGKSAHDINFRNFLEEELGDVLWYVANTATELGVSLSDVAAKNLAKLESRQQRQVLHGEGDRR